MQFLNEAIIFLASAVILVPIFKKIGLSSVLGFLASGLVIGPHGFGFVKEVTKVLHFSEIGIILLLFVIGLELQPSRLWILRKQIFGLGLMQMAVTTTVIFFIAHFLDYHPATSLIIGFGLALSSTAFVLQELSEKKAISKPHGRLAFTVLLFQDMAIIPFLAMIPFLAASGMMPTFENVSVSLVKIIGIIVLFIYIGRYILRYTLRFIASANNNDIFTAVTLLVAIGSALLIHHVTSSMELGAFLAGVLLADSEYRHELEASVAPFKGLLLGLFFMAIGMTINVNLLSQSPLFFIVAPLGLIAIKYSLLMLIVLGYKKPLDTGHYLALILSQGGEFAFILFTTAQHVHIIDPNLVSMLNLVVTLSIAFSPIIYKLNDKLASSKKVAQSDEPDEAHEFQANQIIIAGFGRYGQIIARILANKGIGFTALDTNATRISFVRKYGNKVYYGDPSNLHLLRAANAEQAKVFVLAIDNVEYSIKTAETVKKNFPDLTIYARARDRNHAYQLLNLGVNKIVRETFFSSVEQSKDILRHLGVSAAETQAIADKFTEYDEKLLKLQSKYSNDQAKLLDLSKKTFDELEQLFEFDHSKEDTTANKS